MKTSSSVPLVLGRQQHHFPPAPHAEGCFCTSSTCHMLCGCGHLSAEVLLLTLCGVSFHCCLMLTEAQDIWTPLMLTTSMDIYQGQGLTLEKLRLHFVGSGWGEGSVAGPP